MEKAWRSRPLLYLDVDGPLNPYAAKPERRPAGYTTHRMKPEGWLAQHPGEPPAYVKPLRVWLNPDHGRRLLDLGELFDLVWATTWGSEANTFIGPVIGLPELPVVHWPETRRDESADADSGAPRLFWKTAHLVEHAAGRPFAWVDDELGAADRAFVTARHGASALLHHVDPRLGLREPDFAALAAFAREGRTDRTGGGMVDG
ncbi:HAD domain-containing protein [Streptomyces sp. DSM 40750]|uniref:HAD domain-containing protein n=1 Tax=Streptomyces sp. DSM 40750 TaxID=2801030 RepID=UPI00214BB369|nr:HAD domain-containing protein [Streptomyces sp. DSM 40750]UUU22923.1 hypothetical protein JIX55_22975 [Streptomyces sp. DSM 40750]